MAGYSKQAIETNIFCGQGIYAFFRIEKLLKAFTALRLIQFKMLC